MRRVPSKEEFLAGITAYDGDNRVYFDALHELQAGWGDPSKMADAIWPLLRNWHAPFYRWGTGDPKAIASGIEQNIGLLNDFRHRTIETMCAADEPKIKTLFLAFAHATRRTNRRGSQPSTVGAAKTLHLLSPGFLPLWDNAISDHYGCEQNAYDYVKFCRIMKDFAAAILPYMNQTDDRSVLKRIDEFNYAACTKRVR